MNQLFPAMGGCAANPNSPNGAHCWHSPSQGQTWGQYPPPQNVYCQCGKKEGDLHGPYYPGKTPHKTGNDTYRPIPTTTPQETE